MASDGTVTIRLATHTDAVVIGKMAFLLLSEIDTARYQEEQYTEFARQFLSHDEGSVILLAFADSSTNTDPVGMATILESVALYAGGAYGEMQELYVDPAHRGLGVGQDLLTSAMTYGRQRGWDRLQLHVSQTEAGGRSFAFYRRHGFEPMGTAMRYLLEPTSE